MVIIFFIGRLLGGEGAASEPLAPDIITGLDDIIRTMTPEVYNLHHGK